MEQRQTCMVGGSYLRKIFAHSNHKEVVRKAVMTLRKRKAEFDVIAIRGFSGSLVGPVLAYLLQKDLLIVRKQEEKSHTEAKIEGLLGRYLIVDDFVASGHTIRTIVETIKAIDTNHHATPVGIYFWKPDSCAYESIYRIPVWSQKHCRASAFGDEVEI